MKITKIKSTNNIEGFGTVAVLEIMSDEKVEVSELPESIDGYTIGAGSIVRTPDGDFAVMGETEWGDWRTHGGGGGGGSELPEVTSDDNGDVLTVVEGAWAKATPPEELPSVTSDDNGDTLTVRNGEWTKDNKLNRFFNGGLKRVALDAYTFSHTLNGVDFSIRPQRCGTVVIFKIKIKGTATANGTYEFNNDLISDLRPAYSVNPEYYDSNGKKASIDISNGVEPIYIECTNGGTWDVEDTLLEIPYGMNSILMN